MKWVKKVFYDLGFVNVILRLNTWNDRRERKIYILLGCERRDK